MQKCDCFSIIKRANQPDQLITIPRRNNSCGIVHRTDKFFGIIAGFPVNGQKQFLQFIGREIFCLYSISMMHPFITSTNANFTGYE